MTATKPLRKIAIVGPESTGKSTLSLQLAKHFGVPWVAEYARYYCQALEQACTWQDEINMLHGQIALEESIIAQTETDFIICDTTILTVKIWSEAFFGRCPEVVLDALKKRHYDFYVLLDIDLPWEDDPLRDFPEQREHFLNVWHQELQSLGANYRLVAGLGSKRFENALAAINQFLDSAKS